MTPAPTLTILIGTSLCPTEVEAVAAEAAGLTTGAVPMPWEVCHRLTPHIVAARLAARWLEDLVGAHHADRG